MAPTEGRVARPERRWGCRRGTPEVGEHAPVHLWIYADGEDTDGDGQL